MNTPSLKNTVRNRKGALYLVKKHAGNSWILFVISYLDSTRPGPAKTQLLPVSLWGWLPSDIGTVKGNRGRFVCLVLTCALVVPLAFVGSLRQHSPWAVLGGRPRRRPSGIDRGFIDFLLSIFHIVGHTDINQVVHWPSKIWSSMYLEKSLRKSFRTPRCIILDSSLRWGPRVVDSVPL